MIWYLILKVIVILCLSALGILILCGISLLVCGLWFQIVEIVRDLRITSLDEKLEYRQKLKDRLEKIKSLQTK